MNDVVGGIAVIQAHPKVAGLFQVCLSLHHKDGHQSPCVLSMMDIDHPVVEPDKLAGEPVWKFKLNHPHHSWIDCSPSVRQFVTVEVDGKTVERELFHNTYNWSCQYVWLKYTACDALYNVWKILNQYGDDEQGVRLPAVTAETFALLQRHGYIC